MTAPKIRAYPMIFQSIELLPHGKAIITVACCGNNPKWLKPGKLIQLVPYPKRAQARAKKASRK